MQTPLISYIIPYYNGQNTVERQLNSIYSVPLEENEFEVILVDDCSPVPAKEALSNYLQIHPNLHLIRHSTNKKQGGAKNTGILVARGSYIAFADQDDTIDPTHIKDILTLAIPQQTDIILCQARKIFPNGKTQTPMHSLENGEIITGAQFCEKKYNVAFSASPWSNIYRREYLIESHRPMAENTLLEDIDWVQFHLFYAKKIMNFNFPIYNWYANTQSITHKISPRLYSAFIAHGYRKIENSKLFCTTSSQFADIVLEDGQYNVSTKIRKAWKVSHPWRIFFSDGCGEISPEIWESLSQLTWDKWTGFLIRNRTFAAIIMTLAFPLRWAFFFKHFTLHIGD